METRWYQLNGPDAACFTETLVFGGARATTALVTYQLSDGPAATDLRATIAITSFDGAEALAEGEAGWASAMDRLEARLVPA